MSTEAGRIAVVLNALSGAGMADAVTQHLQVLFEAAGREVYISVAESGDDLRRIVAAAVADGVDAVVAGGGDGTIRCAASALVGSNIPLGVVPLGTLNHFAKDLGIPIDLDEAVGVILAGHSMRVDVGEANGHFFLNNSSLGLYPRIVRLRQRYKAHGYRKWIVAMWATLKVLEENPIFAVRIDVDGQVAVRRTSLLLIGNNAYRMEGIDAGSRLSLTDGELAIYVVRGGGKWKLLRLMWDVFAGRGEEGPSLDVLTVKEATIEARAQRMHVAFDGDVELVDLPLDYRCRPAALSVFVPKLSEADAPP